MRELETVITTDELSRRPPRSPGFEAENAALVRLAQHMADSPGDILQNLAETALMLCRAGSAGVSLEENGTIFRWHGLAGELACHRWGTTPRGFSPCGTVLDRNATLLMYKLERHFDYFARIKPTIVEALLVPFSVAGETVGTVWIVSHDDMRKFDAEDKRVVGNLANFAAAAYQARLSYATLKDSERHKDEFLAMLGHELRNPLFPLRNAVKYLSDRGSPEDHLQRATAVIDRQVRHMARLVDDLLDAARITHGKIELRKERVELLTLVRNAADAYRPLFEAAGHIFTVSLPAEAVYLNADPDRLEHILDNLLTNAAKYTREIGQIRLIVEAAGSEVIIRIKDTGIGIAPDKLRSIFELFSQVDASEERSHGGLGVGLALVQYLIEGHGGSIAALSTGRNEGSEFVIRLPIEAVPSEVFPSQPMVTPRAVVASCSLRILVADDNRDGADSLAMLLQTVGHEVWTVYDGLSALQTARECKPHVVLSDLAIPGMSGYDIARQLRDDPRTRDCILVAVTGYAQSSNGKRIKEAGFDHFLIKPVEFERLQELLNSIVVPDRPLLPEGSLNTLDMTSIRRPELNLPNTASHFHANGSIGAASDSCTKKLSG